MLDDATVLWALDGLKEREPRLVRFVLPSHGRSVVRYRHVLDEVYGLDVPGLALLAILLLRGAQTPGELRARAGRMAEFASVEEVQEQLERLAVHPETLVRLLPRRPGQKEDRWQQLLAAPWPGVTDVDPGAGVELASPGNRISCRRGGIGGLKGPNRAVGLLIRGSAPHPSRRRPRTRCWRCGASSKSSGPRSSTCRPRWTSSGPRWRPSATASGVEHRPSGKVRNLLFGAIDRWAEWRTDRPVDWVPAPNYSGFATRQSFPPGTGARPHTVEVASWLPQPPEGAFRPQGPSAVLRATTTGAAAGAPGGDRSEG